MKKLINGTLVDLTPTEAADLAILQAPPPVTFQPMPRAKFWLTALSVGVTKAAIMANINTITDTAQREYMTIMVEETQVYRREDPLVAQFAAMQNIPSAQLDALWLWASNT